MGKPTICIGENKDADQLRGTAKLISAFVFATRIVQFLFFLNPKFQASSLLLCLCRPVCVRPVRKPHCWFSHEAAQIVTETRLTFLVCICFCQRGVLFAEKIMRISGCWFRILFRNALNPIRKTCQ